MEDIKSLFSKGQFDEIVKKYLKFSKEVKVSRDPVESKKNRTIVYRVLAACEQCGYYCDYLDVLKKLNELVPLKTSCWDKRDLAIMVDFALESLLYCLYNKELDKLDIKYNIPEQIEKIIDFQNSIIQNPNSTYSDTRKKELQALYEDYKNNHYPIYTIEYLYPFEPIVKDYTFDLSPCYPYISMEVKEVQRGNDNYTSFKFKAYGLIKPDTFWRGPKYDTQEISFQVDFMLKPSLYCALAVREWYTTGLKKLQNYIIFWINIRHIKSKKYQSATLVIFTSNHKKRKRSLMMDGYHLCFQMFHLCVNKIVLQKKKNVVYISLFRW